MEEKPIYEGTIRVSCIAIGTKQAYILHFLDYDNYNAAVAQWPEIVNEITSANVELYTNIFRDILDISSSIELEEERELVHSRFGPLPMDNEEFVTLLNQIKEEYEGCRGFYPEFLCWVTENFDCEYELVPGIFHFEN